MKIGYVRVSTNDQSTQLQIDALNDLGVERIYEEKLSGKTIDRPELNKMIDVLRKGDTVYVYKLDRLGRSLKHLLNTVESFEDMGVNFVSVKDDMNTSTAAGKLIFRIFASLAEFEADLIRERTIAGLESARAEGRVGGRPNKLNDQIIKQAITLIESGQSRVGELADQYGVDRRTLGRNIKSFKERQANEALL